MIEDDLMIYLRERWRKSNHNKYQKYFDEWVANITDVQIYYFRKDMIKSKN